MELHLGVVDIPYADKSGATTGDVAEWLENHYGVMQFFYSRHESEIAAALKDSVEGALESLLLGAPPSVNIFGAAVSQIEDIFRKFLDAKEMDGQPGVPTAASLRGESKRFKTKRGPPRPSFIDTGLYEADFVGWID